MSSPDFRLGDFVVHPATDRLTSGDLRIELEPKTMAVLVALAEQPGEVIGSAELIRIVWEGRPMGENPVYKSIAKLRRALDDETDEPRYIETIPRKGYRLLMRPQALAAMAEEPPATAPLPAARRSHWTGWQSAALGSGIAVVILAIIAGSNALLARKESQAYVNASASVPRLYFPGLKSDSADVVAINTMIRERLSHLPELALSDLVVDAPLSALRLSGSAEADGGQLRVRMRLDGERGSDLWSSELLLPVTESYRIADQIAAAVQEAASLAPGDRQLEALPFPALQAYLQARTELRERRSGFRQRMMDASTEVVRAAPDFARGHAIHAVACIFFTNLGSDTDIAAGLQCARESVARALALGPELAEAHAAAGLLAQQEGNYCIERCAEHGWYAASQRSLERAVRLDSSLPEARIWLSNAYEVLGDLARTAAQREAALTLDPLSPIANFHMNNVLIARGELDLVRGRLLRLVRAPGMPVYLYEQLAEISIDTHRFDEARIWAHHTAAADFDRVSQLTAAGILARSGEPREARELYANLSWTPEPLDGDLYLAVRLHQVLGGTPEVRDFIDSQMKGALATEKPGEQSDRRLRRAIGWSLVMADQPERGMPWLESVYGDVGAPRLDVRDIDAEVEGLEALAWASEMRGDTTRARLLAESAIELLSVRAAAGEDQDSEYLLAYALALRLGGRRESAVAELERAVDRDWAEPVFIRADPRWGSLRGDPAVEILLARADRHAAPVPIAAPNAS